MFDVIQAEIEKLEAVKDLNVNINFILVRGDKIYNVFKMVEGYEKEELNGLYKDIGKYRKMSGEKMSSTEFMIIWSATKISSKAGYQEKNEYYKITEEFVEEHSDTTVLQNYFNSKLQEYNGVYRLGRTDNDKKKTDSYKQSLIEFKEFLGKLQGVHGFDYSVEERVLEIQHNYEAGYGIDMFNEIQVNDYVNFAAINLNRIKTEKKGVKISTDRRFKIYNNPSRAFSFPPEWKTETNIPFTLNMKIFTREDTPELYNNKSSYSNIIYEFINNRFLMYYPVDKSESQDIVVKRFTSRLPNIKFEDPVEYQVTGSFVVRNFVINNAVFVDMIMTNPILRNFVYVDESQNTFAQKKRLTLHFVVGSQHVSITLSLRKSKQSEIFYYEDTGTRFENDEDYLHIQINRALNEDYAHWLVLFVKKILKYYLDVNANIITAYKNVISNFNVPILKLPPPKSKVSKANMTKLKKLKLADPDLIVTKYATVCQASSQPTVINKSEVAYWQEQGKQVVKFPARIVNGPQFTYKVSNYYISQNDKTPYIGLMRNTLSNKKQFPYLPCCYKEKHIEVDPKTWDITILEVAQPNIKDETETEETEEKKSKKGNKNYILDRNKLLEPDRRGNLSTKISTFLGGDNYVRYGIPQSTSSFLTCLIMAIKEYRTEYNKASNKEEYIHDLRLRLIDTIKPIISKQENFDRSLNDIIDDFYDPNVCLDPFLHYRIFEEFFQINIFTFTTVNKEPILEIPRHLYFHIRDYSANDRPTVIIYKHYNSGDTNTDCPECAYKIHCELIIRTGNKNVYQFDNSNSSDFYLKMLDLLKQTSSVLSIRFQNTFDVTRLSQNLYINRLLSIAPSVSFLISPLWHLDSQSIDPAGKVRGLTYRKDNISVSIETPFLPVFDVPSLPLSPSSSDNISEFISDNKLQVSSLQFISDDQLYKFYTTVPQSDLITAHNNARRIANILRQVIKILFLLSSESVSIFSKRFLIKDVSYDISLVSRRLPRFTSYSSAFTYFSRILPSFFSSNKIVLDYSDLLDGILHYLKLLRPQPIPRFFDHFYSTPSDFTLHTPYQLVYFDESSLSSSLPHLTPPSPSISTKLHYSQQPYLLVNQDRLFLVQNVFQGDLSRAISVLYYWFNHFLNPGYFVQSLNPSLLSSFSYNTISSYSESSPILDPSICFFQNGYCALLPLDISVSRSLL